MHNSKQQSEIKITQSNTDNPSKRRRAFIKGSAAALPVVLTLRNGSAFAADSISCLVRQANLTPVTLADKADGFVRDETTCRVLSSGMTLYQYPPNSGNWYPDNVNSTNELARFVMVDGTNNQMAQINTHDPIFTFEPGRDKLCYVIAHLDATSGLRVPDPSHPDRSIVGPKDNNQSTVFSTQSCMASLAQHP